jgi:hypothetical protein
MMMRLEVFLEEDKAKLLETMQRYNEASDYIADKAYKDSCLVKD